MGSSSLTTQSPLWLEILSFGRFLRGRYCPLTRILSHNYPTIFFGLRIHLQCIADERRFVQNCRRSVWRVTYGRRNRTSASATATLSQHLLFRISPGTPPAKQLAFARREKSSPLVGGADAGGHQF